MHHAVGVDDQCAVAVRIEAQMNARLLERVLAGVVVKASRWTVDIDRGRKIFLTELKKAMFHL
jgi:hypothetical protein